MLRKYEMVWRPNYEFYSATGWLISIAMMFVLWSWASLPTLPFLYLTGVATLFLVRNGLKALRLWEITFNLCGKGISFISDTKLFSLIRKRPGCLWMGKGFDWTPVHTQRLYEIKRINPQVMYPPALFMWLRQLVTREQVGALTNDYIGAPWIHGVEPKEEDIYVPIEHFVGNTLILGTTRCGKTRMLELIVEMAISMGYTVISIDPKGDQAYEHSMVEACRVAGRMESYARFHLAFPKTSIRIDPLKNYINPSDLPSRITALMGGGDDGSSFRDFAWGVLNSITLGMFEVGEKPTLVKIRSYANNGVADLLRRVVLNYFDAKLPPKWEDVVVEYARTLKTARGKEAFDGEILVRQSLNLMVSYFRNVLKPQGHQHEALETLAATYEHDAAHYSKMIQNLLPILAMLTTGELGGLMSPDPRDIADTRQITDFQALIRSKSVVYIGLDSLANKTISSAVGSLLLSDLTSVAASIYNYQSDQATNDKIFLIVDELAEVVNEPYIQMLNKSSGAGFVNFGVAQTVSDFSARFGSMDKARQMLGNFNNLVAMRLKDKGTQEFAVETFGESYVQSKEVTRSTSTNTKTNAAHFTGTIGEKTTDSLETVIPMDTFVRMPNWQYVASVSGGRIVKGRLSIIKHAHA
jgi:conjugal transfer pilus assembly protein TraD